jgi:peptidyl-prolyl cis-trans isomerase D
MSKSKDKGPKHVGLVDGKKVSFEGFYAALSGVRTQVIMNYFNQPKLLDQILNNRPLVAKIAWDRVLMLSDARKMRIKVSDKEVIAFLKNHPLFTRNGKFDEKFYAYVLRNNIGLEPRAFEEAVRENLIIQKLSATVAGDIKPKEEEVFDEYKKDFSKIKIAYVMLKPEDFAGEVKPDEAAIKDFYEKHKSELIIKSSLKGALPDRQATLEEAAPEIEKRLKIEGAAQMLKGKSDAAYDAITKRMSERSENFEKAAAQLKYAVKTADYFSRADKVDDLGDAYTVAVIAVTGAGMKPLEVSKPVGATKGFFIFEVLDKKDPDAEAFKKERDAYAEKVRQKKVDAIMEDRLRKLEGEAKLEVNLEEIDKYYR